MRLVFGLVLIIGLGLAGFAVYMVQGYFNQYESALAQERRARSEQVPLADIYVAARPVRYGEVLRPEDVRLVPFPARFLPPGSFQDPDVLFPENNRDPRIVLRVMEENEPILASKVTRPGDEAGVSAFLSPGMRAFAVRVNVDTGVSGFVGPGDRVDMFWSGRIGESSVTKLILSNVKIIAIDQIADQDRLDPRVARTVTVEVTPQQVASLAQAQATGKLSLALVGVLDTDTITDVIEENQSSLLGIQEVVTEQRRVCTIKTRRAGEEIVKEIPCPTTN